MIKFLDFMVLIGYCLLIYQLSAQSTLPMPMLFSFQDKVHHAAAYFVMGLLTWRCFRHISKHPIILSLLSLGFCSFYGFSDEWHQAFVPGRNSDRLDWVADTLGAALAMVMILFYRKRLRSKF